MQKDFKNYCEFMDALNEDADDRFETILDYEDFEIYRDKKTNRFYYVECSENDADEFYEVEPIATLIYSVTHDISIKSGDVLHSLFDDACCCGERVIDDGIEYMWFSEVI